LWQWQRGMDKLPLEQALAMRQVQTPASTLPVQGAANLARYRLQGVRAAGLPILLANSLLDGMPGQRVLQPLRLADGSLILADLGWRAANRPLPDLVLPAQLPGQWWPWHGRWTLPGARLGTAGEVDAVDMAALTSLSGPLACWCLHRPAALVRLAAMALQPPCLPSAISPMPCSGCCWGFACCGAGGGVGHERAPRPALHVAVMPAATIGSLVQLPLLAT
jgi:hypothetical protein